ncbi:hypothetical protein OG394_38970 [Kribbella sp. NBC_01245]|uniref:hypothetical protein n=1 Tax=Kribbella sp. NBC_01245 TaxID=2903578 RepID=UPI002E27E59F|nr:hypothetical protein [Kribbella sp. NBC_01245]
MLRTPRQDEARGIGTNRPSAADIYIIQGADYVQWGWYLGSASQLPTVSTPHVFVGEYRPGYTNDELLRQGPALAWDTFYLFRIEFTGEDGLPGQHYRFYFNNTYRFTTTAAHSSWGTAAFNGEVASTCTLMRARAYRSTAPTRVLMYLTYGSGGSVWHFFSDDYFNDPGFFSYDAGDIATNFAYGGTA